MSYFSLYKTCYRVIILISTSILCSIVNHCFYYCCIFGIFLIGSVCLKSAEARNSEPQKKYARFLALSIQCSKLYSYFHACYSINYTTVTKWRDQIIKTSSIALGSHFLKEKKLQEKDLGQSSLSRFDNDKYILEAWSLNKPIV